MSNNPEELATNHDAWEGASAERLGEAKACKVKVKKALHELEKKQAAKVAAALEEQRRLAAAEAAAAAKARREQEAKVQAEFKRMQAAGLQAQKDAVKAANRGEAQALKAATADFQAAKRDAHILKMKNKRMSDIKRVESDLANAFILCQKQYRVWFVDVQKVEMRLEAREKRPGAELFADHVQMALERELTTLIEARAALKGLVDEGEKLNAEMKETTMLLVTGRSRENVMGRRDKMKVTLLAKSNSTPSLPAISPKRSNSAPEQDFVERTDNMFINNNPTQEELLDRARDQVRRAADLTAECAQVLANCRNNCSKVSHATNVELEKKKADIDVVRKGLENEKKEAAGSIKDALHRITMLKMKATHHAQSAEDDEEMQACEAMLAELNEAKEVLDDDWRAKSVSFKIDGFCRNLTPIRAATLFKQPGSAGATQSMKLDSGECSNEFE